MGPELSNLLETFGYGAIVGLVTWLVRRVFTHTIPRLAQDFKESLIQQQNMFVDQLAAQREDFKVAMREQREDFKEALVQERDDFGKRLDRLTTAVEKMLSMYDRDRRDAR